MKSTAGNNKPPEVSSDRKGRQDSAERASTDRRSDAQSHSDFAAISYIWIRLKGRAKRLRHRLVSRSAREKLLLNETVPRFGFTERLARVTDPRSQTGYERVARQAALRKVIACLTDKELSLLHAIYWEQKRIIVLCEERGVSKNSVLKMKRNALAKLRRALRDLESLS